MITNDEIVLEQMHRIRTIEHVLSEGVGPKAEDGLRQSLADARQIIRDLQPNTADEDSI